MAIFSNEFLHRVSAGKVKGAKIVNKFGQINLDSTFRPVTDDRRYYTPTAAVNMYINSTSAQDSSTGTGARLVEVSGLDGNFDEQSELVQMNGTSNVSLTKAFIRVHRMRVVESGTYSGWNASSHSGVIRLYDASNDVLFTSIRNYETLGIGTTLIGAYSVPRKHTAHILSTTHNIEDSRGIDLIYLVREHAELTTAPYKPMRALNLFRTVASSTDSAVSSLGLELNGACDIIVVARLSDMLGGSAEFAVNFELLVLDNR